MSELGIDAPVIGSVGEGQYLDVIRLKNGGENGSYLPNLGGNFPESEKALQKEDQIIEDHLQSSPSDESFGTNNDADESMTETTSSGFSARMEDGAMDGGISSGHCFEGWKMVVAGVKEIFFHADFVMYESIYLSNYELVFADSFLEAKGVPAYGDQDNFCIRLRLDDIVLIESHWVGRFQTAKVQIYATSENEEVETNCPVPRIKKMEFAVIDPCWYEKCEAIRSLDVRYDALWKVANDTEMEEYGDTLGQKTLQTSYFPDFKPFEDFIYPEGDTDAVSISKRDVDLLQPDTFVNDTIIDFYIKYLKDKMLAEKRQRFHFFNSFFFRKLADLEK